MRFFVHIMMVIALISAGISPACAFNNGVTYLCGTTQEAKVIQAPAELLAFMSIDEDAPEPRDAAIEDCPFCISFLDSKALGMIHFHVLKSLPDSYISVSNGLSIPQSLELRVFQARAPPVFS